MLPDISSSSREVSTKVSTRESPKELKEAALAINVWVNKLISARLPEQLRQVECKEEVFALYPSHTSTLAKT